MFEVIWKSSLTHIEEHMTGWSSTFCTTNHINLHYTRTGGNKPPLILLHGLLGNGLCWTPVAQALENKFDVIMPDARGHGRSSAPDDGYRYEDHANDIMGLIEALKLSQPILMGHSMGGMTAALIASRSQKMLRSLILADPTFLSPEYQQKVYESDVVQQHVRLLTKSAKETLREAQSKSPHRPLNTIKLITRARYQTNINAFQVLAPPNPEYKLLVRSIDIPTLLVISEKGIISPSMAEELQKLNSKIRIAKIVDAGHGLHYDQPEQFIAILQSFLCSTLIKKDMITKLKS